MYSYRSLYLHFRDHLVVSPVSPPLDTLPWNLAVADRIGMMTAINRDLLITGLILNKLIRSKTGWSQTDALISKLAIMTMESQAPPTLFCLVVAVHFSVTFS
jgi:hypothetical protein